MSYIQRFLEKTIMENMKCREIIALIGPRQSGKTTLLKHIYEAIGEGVFLSFDDREELELFVEDEKAFAELHAKNSRYLFIDEFQYAKEGGKKLKYIYDNFPKTKIIISGSSAPGLTIHGIKYLVGRIFVFNLYPLSFEELLSYKDKPLFDIYLQKKQLIRKSLFSSAKLPAVSTPLMQRLSKIYKEYLIYGGYPRVCLSKTEDEKKTVLKNIYNTYFLREIKNVIALTTDFNLAKLIKALSLQLGGIAAYNSLAEVSGLDYKTLLTHLNILEKTFICKRVLPFFTNRRTELVKAPKVYFFDTGLRNAVIDDFRPYEKRQDIGQLNENFIFSELSYAGHEVRYWRSKSKAEVDFVLDKQGKLIAIESKNVSVGSTKSLRAFTEKYKPYKTIIASTDRLQHSGGVFYLPFVFISSLH
jgi:predicted AAA+ superfamily ATPase